MFVVQIYALHSENKFYFTDTEGKTLLMFWFETSSIQLKMCKCKHTTGILIKIAYQQFLLYLTRGSKDQSGPNGALDVLGVDICWFVCQSTHATKAHT